MADITCPAHDWPQPCTYCSPYMRAVDIIAQARAVATTLDKATLTYGEIIDVGYALNQCRQETESARRALDKASRRNADLDRTIGHLMVQLDQLKPREAS